jgi:hypothetical protein
MNFLRHVGKQGDRKVAVIFREIPGEPHMCLVVYTELLNQHIHDPLVKTIESEIGQNSESLADALNRSYTKDGRIILQVLHSEHQLKKVQTSQIVMTPQPNVKIRLDELNNILNEMKKGEDAVRRLAEIDKSNGLQDPSDVARRMKGDKLPQQLQENKALPVNQSMNAALDDSSIARQRFEQAQRMEREAHSLLAESKRLIEEAKSLDPTVVPTPVVNNVTVSEVKAKDAPAKRKYTRKNVA